MLGVVLKFVPLIVTMAPTAPADGLNPVSVGEGNTMKSVVLVPVMPLTAMEITPVVAPAGTTAVILVVVEDLTLATTPLNLTVLLPGVALKLTPVIMMSAPVAALTGVKFEMVGTGTVKLPALFPVIPFMVTDIGPVVAPAGTDVVILVDVEAVTTATTPLNLTIFSAGTLLKFVPVMVTGTPTPPLVGEKLLIEGVPKTVKFVALVTITPLNDTVICPVPAPRGTLVVILVELKEETIAGVPLNSTIGVEMKFVPVMVTVAPTPASVGAKPVMVGDANTLKLLALCTVTPFTITDIFPDVAPSGTVVVRLLSVEEVTVAIVLLNFTT